MTLNNEIDTSLHVAHNFLCKSACRLEENAERCSYGEKSSFHPVPLETRLLLFRG